MIGRGRQSRTSVSVVRDCRPLPIIISHVRGNIHLQAAQSAKLPTNSAMTFSLRRLLIGDPLQTSEASHQKLSNIIALPVFASDALSSVAFATEEMMAALLIAGAVPYFGLTPILAASVALLLAIVVVSYRQTLSAYPGGGGAYTVAGDNLGPTAGRTAGAALLLDYVLNAAVCASAGVAAAWSAVVLVELRRLCRCFPTMA